MLSSFALNSDTAFGISKHYVTYKYHLSNISRGSYMTLPSP